jgi:hypothetical protein
MVMSGHVMQGGARRVLIGYGMVRLGLEWMDGVRLGLVGNGGG